MPGSLVKGTLRRNKQTKKPTYMSSLNIWMGRNWKIRWRWKREVWLPPTPVSMTMFVIVSFTVYFSLTLNTDRETDGKREGDRYRWYVWYHTNIKPGLTFNISKTLSTVSKDQDKSINRTNIYRRVRIFLSLLIFALLFFWTKFHTLSEKCFSAIYAVKTQFSLLLKVHKNENFFGFDFEFCTISLLVMSKY